MAKLEEMSKEELVAALRAAQDQARSAEQDAADHQAIVHDLEVHQIELEMQNRQLREAQHDLEQARQRYSDLYNFAPVVYLTLDRDGRIEEVNLTATTLLGVERRQLVGKLLVTLVALSHRARFRSHLQRCLDEGAAQTELMFAIGDRPPLAVEIVSVAFRDEDGRIVGCRTTLTDITAAKRIEDRLTMLAAASQILGGSIESDGGIGATLGEVLRLLVPSQADLAFVDLVDGRQFRRFESGPRPGSPAAGRPDRGFPAPALGPDAPQHRVVQTGKPILVPSFAPGPLSRADWLDHEQAIRAVGARSLLYLPLLSRDQRLGVLTLVSTDDQRRYGGADLAFATDLASRIAVAVDNEALYRNAAVAIRAREDVLSFVAHDLRGLVNGIQLTVEMMLGKSPEPERRRGWNQLERIQRVTDQMSRMIDDIQDVASIEAGKLVFDLADLIVDDLVIQTRDQLGSAAAKKGVALEARVTNQAVQVRADLPRAMRVLANLIGNAIKFTPEGGTVTLSSSIAHRHVLFAVRDTGIGIPEDQVPKLFDRYWQANESGHKGRGLGLFIAKRLVEGQGGTIWAESKLGAGTTMYFTLPRSSPAEARAHEPAAEASGAQASGAQASGADAEPTVLERR